MHLYLEYSTAFAFLTSTFTGVEAKTTRTITSCLGSGHHGKEIPYLTKGLRVGRRITSGGSSNRTLVNKYKSVKMLDSLNCIMRTWNRILSIDSPCKCLVESLMS